MSGTPDTPLLSVDGVIFDSDGVVLIRRKNPPFQNAFALPGGFVDRGETVEAACIREVKEETGITVTSLRLVGVFSDPGRDPRGHNVAIAFLAEGDIENMQAGDDAADVQIVQDWREQRLAFDHRNILEQAYGLHQKKR